MFVGCAKQRLIDGGAGYMIEALPNAFSSYLFDFVSKRCDTANLWQNCYQRLKQFDRIKIWVTPGHANPTQWPVAWDLLCDVNSIVWPCFCCITDAIADPNGEIAPAPVSRCKWRHNLIMGLKLDMSGHAHPCKLHKLQYMQIFFCMIFFSFRYLHVVA